MKLNFWVLKQRIYNKKTTIKTKQKSNLTMKFSTIFTLAAVSTTSAVKLNEQADTKMQADVTSFLQTLDKLSTRTSDRQQ